MPQITQGKTILILESANFYQAFDLILLEKARLHFLNCIFVPTFLWGLFKFKNFNKLNNYCILCILSKKQTYRVKIWIDVYKLENIRSQNVLYAIQ